MKVSPVSADLLIKLGIGIAVLGLGYYAVKKVAGIGGEVLDTVTETTTGLWTGNNAITENARTDAYKNMGPIGTIGAATDRVTGGYLSQFGEWLGGKAADIFQPSYNPNQTPTPARSAYWKS